VVPGTEGTSGWNMLARFGMEAVDITSSSLKDGHLKVFAV
jgi:hypothetical protein